MEVAQRLGCKQGGWPMLGDHIDGFIEHLKSSGKTSELTLISYRTDLKQFLTYLSLDLQMDGAAIEIGQLNYGNVKRYLLNMQESGFSRATLARKHATIRSFVRYLCFNNVLPGNPIASVQLPERPSAARDVDINNIEALLSAPNENKAAGMRDKTIIELLYFCRLRIMEVAGINLDDVDLKKKVIRICRHGERERLVGAGKRVRSSIKKYVEHARPPLSRGSGPGEEALFISKNGSRLTARAIRSIINKYIERIAAEHETNAQTLRFAVASQFVKGGTDMKAVQEIFGLGRAAAGHLYSQMDQERHSRAFS